MYGLLGRKLPAGLNYSVSELPLDPGQDVWLVSGPSLIAQLFDIQETALFSEMLDRTLVHA